MPLPRRLDDIPANATAEQVFEAIRANVDDTDHGEDALRSFIIRILALLGYGRSPRITSGSLAGARVRIYEWKDTPAGDLVFLCGPQFKGKLVRPNEIQVKPGEGIWLAAAPDTSKAADKAKAEAARYTGVAASQRAVVKQAERETEARTERKAATKPAPATAGPAAAPRARPPAAPKATDVEAAERTELRAGISQLADLLK